MSIHPGPGEGVIPVTFRLPAEVTATKAHVVGDFNDWSTDAHPMDRDDQGFHVESRSRPVAATSSATCSTTSDGRTTGRPTTTSPTSSAGPTPCSTSRRAG